MFKKLFLFLFVSFFAVNSFGQTIDPLDKMPILEKSPNDMLAGAVPVEQRGEEFRKYLATSVKISVTSGSGSGTIIYYDREKNLAYVASCGHLWPQGVMTYEDGKKRNLECVITTWYHNQKKLQEPENYTAKVLMYSHLSAADISLVVFSPNWEPIYFPVAPLNYTYDNNKLLHSLGCDGGDEVAHYSVQPLGLIGGELATFRNSPRPGRSGGGLIDDYGWFVGVCRATQFKDGSGKGFFTALPVIHKFYSSQKFDFLLNMEPLGVAARKIPIMDKRSNQGYYQSEYILIPGLEP
jgi:hypothetical protein